MLIQCIISGAAYGSVYALVALGYSIIYSTMRMGHFAQGDFFMFGAFIGWYVVVKWKVPILMGFLLSVIGTAILMLTIERLTYRPMYTREGMGLLISTMGMQYIIQGAAKFLFGNEPKAMPPIFGPASSTYHLVKIFGMSISISHTELMLVIICSILMLALTLFIKYTKIGVAMSAVSMNRRAAQMMGIKLTTIIATTYILAAALAAMAGVLMAPRFSVTHAMGGEVGTGSMTAAVMGGFGSMPGAMLGGVLFGIIETLSAFYLSTAYKEAFMFAVLVIILFWRPQGILGRRSITKV